MPAAKPKPKRKQGKAPVKAQVVAKPKTAAKRPDAHPAAPTLNGLPLRRRTVWAIDTDSPQFQAARKRDAQALSRNPDNRDSMQFSEALLADKDMQKWWN
jgi:hypothetical protein